MLCPKDFFRDGGSLTAALAFHNLTLYLLLRHPNRSKDLAKCKAGERFSVLLQSQRSDRQQLLAVPSQNLKKNPIKTTAESAPFCLCEQKPSAGNYSHKPFVSSYRRAHAVHALVNSVL